MRRIRPEDWRPQGIEGLEPQAWRALRQAGCACVVAGPGSGKTEFLAQRAVYVLQTGICAPPYRVLAISFKSDAAENLAARVRLRCPPELANRFVSLTFDAFTKGMVDRFTSAIPPGWRPSRPTRDYGNLPGLAGCAVTSTEFVGAHLRNPCARKCESQWTPRLLL
jgi:hypothetical protein